MNTFNYCDFTWAGHSLLHWVLCRRQTCCSLQHFLTLATWPRTFSLQTGVARKRQVCKTKPYATESRRSPTQTSAPHNMESENEELFSMCLRLRVSQGRKYDCVYRCDGLFEGPVTPSMSHNQWAADDPPPWEAQDMNFIEKAAKERFFVKYKNKYNMCIYTSSTMLHTSITYITSKANTLSHLAFFSKNGQYHQPAESGL